jgi:hypothetical protein
MQNEWDFGYKTELEYVNKYKSKFAFHMYNNDGDLWFYCSLYKYI